MVREDNWDICGRPGEFVYGDDTYIDEYYLDERWKIIPYAPQYWVSDHARVYNSKTNTFMKLKKLDKHGHLGVCMTYNGKRIYKYIHRLMAEAFISNPNNYPIVRHLDDKPDNNDIQNIRWGTTLDNYIDCVNNGNVHYVTDDEREKGCIKTRTPLISIKISDGYTQHFNSQAEASKCLNVPQSNIWKVLNGKRNNASGYYFEYDLGGKYGI